MWREGTRAGAVRTFYQRHAAFHKTGEINGNHPRKGAFGYRADLHPVSYGIAGGATLHPCVTRWAWMKVRQWGRRTRSIEVSWLRRFGPRNGDRLAEQLLEFLLALDFGLVHFEFPLTGLPFHSRSQARRQRMFVQGVNRERRFSQAVEGIHRFDQPIRKHHNASQAPLPKPAPVREQTWNIHLEGDVFQQGAECSNKCLALSRVVEVIPRKVQLAHASARLAVEMAEVIQSEIPR